jgi:hypothetical protein
MQKSYQANSPIHDNKMVRKVRRKEGQQITYSGVEEMPHKNTLHL